MISNYVYNTDELKLELRESENEISLIWYGESTQRDPAKFLTPILDEILSLIEMKQKKLIVDFRQLQFMNSPTLTPIIRLIEKVRKGNNEILVIYQKKLDWQELCFSALCIFMTKDRRIDIKGL